MAEVTDHLSQGLEGHAKVHWIPPDSTRSEPRLTRNGRPAARIPKLSDTDGSAAECEKILPRNADDPSTMLAACEREAIGVARAVLARAVDEEFNAR